MYYDYTFVVYMSKESTQKRNVTVPTNNIVKPTIDNLNSIIEDSVNRQVSTPEQSIVPNKEQNENRQPVKELPTITIDEEVDDNKFFDDFFEE